jgi:integrase
MRILRQGVIMLQNFTNDEIEDLIHTGYLYHEDDRQIDTEAQENRSGRVVGTLYEFRDAPFGAGTRYYQSPSDLLLCEYLSFDDLRSAWKYHGVLLGNLQFCQKLVHDKPCACGICTGQIETKKSNRSSHIEGGTTLTNNQPTYVNHLTKDQVQQLHESLRGHHLEAILTLALVTGLRRDELLSLKWQDVDLDTSTMRVLNSKTKSDVRTVPIPADVALLLEEHRANQMETQGQVGLTWANLDLVFPDGHGEPLDPHLFLKEFHAVLEQAGLPDIHFHDLRSSLGQALYRQYKAEQQESE